MDPTVLTYLGLLVLLLIASSFFSSSETALFSLSPLQVRRIQESHHHVGATIARHLESPTQLLSTILIGNTVVNVIASVVGFACAEHAFPARGEIISIPAMTILLLLFGEVAPKRLAIRYPDKMAVVYMPILHVLTIILLPVRVVLQAISNAFEKHIRPGPRHLTEDEFRSVVGMSEEQGVLDPEERTMVDGIIRLEDIQASDVMTPRVDLIAIDLNDPAEQHLQTARNTKVRFLPVHRDSLDEVDGFLDVLKFLLSPLNGVEAAMSPAHFIPETATLDTLLATFQQEEKRVAIVSDEFGGTAGLVTLGDVLEEIVDDVENEYGEEKLTIEPVGPDTWLVDGSVSLEDLSYELDIDLKAEGADRVAGWVNAQAGHIPRPGEVVEAQGCRARVQRVHRNRVILVHLTKLQDVSPSESDEEQPTDS
jgi:CBS domain containing-hemolysin-like protein